MASDRYGIHEWYGRPLLDLAGAERSQLASAALESEQRSMPACPFQLGNRACRKRGGVCSIRKYRRGTGGSLGRAEGAPVIVCPARFEQDRLAVNWLAEIVGFDADDAQVASEVAFMRGTRTTAAAGKIDLVVARSSEGNLDWFGLEIQAVYFSGQGMRSEFERLLDASNAPLFPNAVRRPDWRSSSAKRLMPQLQIKVPTLRRWGSKMAVLVDRPFFNAIGGASTNPSQDLADGDIIWMVVDMTTDSGTTHRLVRGHWEVLTLEASCDKLLAAETIQRDAFLSVLRRKLQPLAPRTE